MDKMNKKAQFFGIYLVLLTLFMCGLSIGIYHFQSRQTGNSLVSPVDLLKLGDEKQLFEIQENETVLVAVKETKDAGFDWGNKEEFIPEFKTRFYAHLINDDLGYFRDFLFSDLKFEGENLRKESFGSESSKITFFNKIYEFNFEDNKLKIIRKPVGKHLSLRASEKNKINFPVEIQYVYEKVYLISEGDVLKS